MNSDLFGHLGVQWQNKCVINDFLGDKLKQKIGLD